MDIKGWKYYNHAAIPTTAPHDKPELQPIEDGSIWKLENVPLLARWTTEFDSEHDTNWWYVIKDTPFDISSLKAKRRYEINKGMDNYKVIEIDPLNYKEELYGVQVAAFSAYPEKYRPTVKKTSFFEDIDKWKQYVVLGAFFRENNELSGYALLSKESEHYTDFKVLKTKPNHERNAVNAALVEGVLRYFKTFLVNGGYICDGARSIQHETAFQDYLEKYFNFRKAYCKLHIVYRPKVGWIVKLAYPLRKLFIMFDKINLFHQINAVLKMEEITRIDTGL